MREIDRRIVHVALVIASVFGLAARTLGQTSSTQPPPKYVVVDLGTLGGPSYWASGINNSGQVVGSASTASGQVDAFRTAANSPINPATDDLGTLGGTSSGVWVCRLGSTCASEANGINDSGQVVGSANTASG